MPTLHRECLLGCGHPPCSRHDSANAAWKVGSGHDLGVGHSVLPGYAKDTADASKVEGIESFLLSCIYVVHASLPYIAVLMTKALYTTILVFTVSLGLVHMREVRQASVVVAFPILLSI